MTLFKLLCDRCGLSHGGAADFLGVRVDTVKSWSAGRNPTPAGVIDALRALYRKIERAAGEVVSLAEARIKAGEAPAVLELGLASDDEEARSLGWPCVGAQAAALGIAAARLDLPVRIVPRGSTPATAAAADVRDALDGP